MSALAIAQVVARNIVPVVGIVVFGWHAFNVLALYFVDTLLTIAAIGAGVARTFVPVETDSIAGRANSEFGFVGAGLMIAGVVAIPLGIPLIFMANGDFDVMRATFADRSFYVGIAVQAAFALWTYLRLRAAIDAGASADALRLKRGFALAFLRWVVVLMVTYAGIGLAVGRFAPLLFVVVYVATSIFIDLAPDRFLRAMPGGAEDAVNGSPARQIKRFKRRKSRQAGE